MKNNPTVNYRNKHILIIGGVVFLILGQILPGHGIWNILRLLLWSFYVGIFVGTFEKKDELTRQNLAKATEITFYVLLAAVFVFSIILLNVDSAALGADMCFYSVLGAAALRSAVFLWLDRAPEEEEEE